MKNAVKKLFALILNRAQIAALVLFALASSSCAATDFVENKNRERDRAALAAARDNIEKFRKATARIRIVDRRGAPVKAANLKIKQISHDFKFGCYLKLDDLDAEKLPEYERRFKQLFNFAVVGTYWSFVEPARGAENWRWFERETAFAAQHDLRVQAAPVLWGTSEFGTPKWLPANPDELAQVLQRRVQTVLRKNSEQIEDWEIVNEPLAPTTDLFAKRAGANYIETAFRTARATAPEARLMINEYAVFGSVPKHNYNREKYFDLLERLIEKNAPVDVVGIQAHASGEWFAPGDVAAELERYGKLGKPLQITEFSAQTFDFADRKTPLRITGNYRAGAWDENKQAEFYREFYTVAFGARQVEAITTWGLDDARAWLPGIGMINERGEPKAAYSALDDLINREWKTGASGATDFAGNFEFRGFYGDYEIEIDAPDRRRTVARFALRKNAANNATIKLD